MKFYHVADIHLGAMPDRGFPWSEERKSEIWESFRSVIRQAEKEGIDLLLIAGDLFHRQPLMRELKEVNYLFSTLSETRVVIVAGNHDYVKKDSCYRGFPWAGNVYFMENASCGKLVFEDLHTAVYGLSYHAREITERLYDGIRPKEDVNFSILLAHGGDERHIPFDKRRLAASGFDYIALGHIHKPGMLLENQMGYAGALEPLDKNDQGVHGFLSGTWEKQKLKVQFIPWACREYKTLEISSDQFMTEYALKEEVSKKIDEEGRKHIYRIRVTGFRDPDIRFDLSGCIKLGNIVETVDDSDPYYDLDKLLSLHDSDMIGRYIRRFQEQPMGIREQKALYYGVQAMLGGSRCGL